MRVRGVSRSTTFTCPDCHASGTTGVAGARDGGLVLHAPSCPAGQASSTVACADAAWFAAHPFAPYRRRPLELAEYAELAALHVDTTAGRWRVLAHLDPNGIRRTLYVDGAAVLTVVDVLEVRG